MPSESGTGSQTANSDKTELVARAESLVRAKLEADSSGHDWWHIHRVRNNAMMLCKMEHADPLVVELAALLHDISDWKFSGDLKASGAAARVWLEEQGAEPGIIDHVCEIIDNVSYKGAGVQTPMRTIEGQIVQDADRLDAIGAVGIARTFAYGGHAGRCMYDPAEPPEMHASFEQYKNSKGHTINHFYEKLLLLKDRMNTGSARRIAEERHAFMEQFLSRFFAEFNGEA